MKKSILPLFVVFAMVASSRAAVLVSGFSSYTNGNLIGQTNPGTAGGSWAQVGTGTVNALTITSGTLGVKPSGQNAIITLTGTAYTDVDLYYGVTLNLSAAQATGNSFLSFSATTTAPGGGGRLYAQSNGAGFVLGASVGTTPTYSSTVLNFGTDYRIVFHYTIATGSSNDSFKLYLDPLSTNEGSNTTLLSATNQTGLGTLQYFEITETSSANGPTGNINNLAVTTTFAEAVPEPQVPVLALGGIGAVFLLRRLRGVVAG